MVIALAVPAVYLTARGLRATARCAGCACGGAALHLPLRHPRLLRPPPAAAANPRSALREAAPAVSSAGTTAIVLRSSCRLPVAAIAPPRQPVPPWPPVAAIRPTRPAGGLAWTNSHSYGSGQLQFRPRLAARVTPTLRLRRRATFRDRLPAKLDSLTMSGIRRRRPPRGETQKADSRRFHLVLSATKSPTSFAIRPRSTAPAASGPRKKSSARNRKRWASSRKNLGKQQEALGRKHGRSSRQSSRHDGGT